MTEIITTTPINNSDREDDAYERALDREIIDLLKFDVMGMQHDDAPIGTRIAMLRYLNNPGLPQHLADLRTQRASHADKARSVPYCHAAAAPEANRRRPVGG